MRLSRRPASTRIMTSHAEKSMETPPPKSTQCSINTPIAIQTCNERRLDPQVLTRYGLPDIVYSMPLADLNAPAIDAGDLPLAAMLYALQHRAEGDVNWKDLEGAMDRLVHLLASDDHQQTLAASGDHWWLEIGPVDLNGKLVTIQRESSLIAAISPREDGRLRVAVFRPLDAQSARHLVGLGQIPHPDHGVCMRENNWEYALDCSAANGNFYSADRGQAYLSFWEKGLGISWDGTEISTWRAQSGLVARKAALVAMELAIHRSAPPAAKSMSTIHPHLNDAGQPVKIKTPHTSSPASAWSNPTAIALVVPGGTLPASLNGVGFGSWEEAPSTNDAWEALAGRMALANPPFVCPPGLKPAAGAVIAEPDGRVWCVAPTNRFGGHEYTFPKGRTDGRSTAATALVEVFEEAGLHVQLVAMLCDVKRATTYTRFYLASRLGGTPSAAGWESQAVMLAPVSTLRKLLTHQGDQAVLDAYALVAPPLI